MKQLDELRNSLFEIRHKIDEFIKENRSALIKEVREQYDLDDNAVVHIYSSNGTVDCFFQKDGKTEHKYYWDGKWT